jgi:hypothetical protein
LRLALCAWYRGDVRDYVRRAEAANAYSVEDMEAASPLVGYAARAFVIGLRGSAVSFSGRFDEGIGGIGEGIAIARVADAIENAPRAPSPKLARPLRERSMSRKKAASALVAWRPR